MIQSVSKKSLVGILVVALMLCFSCGLVLNVETAWADKSNPNTFTTKPAAKAGWQQDSKGWRYKNSDGSYVKNDWKKIDGKWYHFNSSAYMQTGWFKDGASWYYLGTNGKMTAGWQKVGGKWYYMANSGKMLTGWLKWDGKWYYLKSSGAMASGWQKVSGKWYYLANSGVMKTGWLQDGGKWYYLTSSGAMAVNTWIKNKGNEYYFQHDGTMATKRWVAGYYVKEDGAYVSYSMTEGASGMNNSSLHFSGKYFTIYFPSSWKGKWDITGHVDEIRPSIGIPNYTYDIYYNDEKCFVIHAHCYNIGGPYEMIDLGVSSSGHYIYIFNKGTLNSSELQYIKNNIAFK